MEDTSNSAQSSRHPRSAPVPARFAQNGEPGAACGHGAAAAAAVAAATAAGKKRPASAGKKGATTTPGKHASRMSVKLPGIAGKEKVVPVLAVESGGISGTESSSDFSDDESDGDMMIDPHGRNMHSRSGAAENADSSGGGAAGKGKAKAKAGTPAMPAPPSRRKAVVLAASLEKVIAAGEGYTRWPAIVLQKMCTRRGRRGLSTYKDRDRMIEALQLQDIMEDRDSPYMGDLPSVLQGEKT